MEPAQAEFLHAERGRHAAFLAQAAAERHADEPAAQIIGPLMVGADEFLGIAAVSLAELGAAMRTTVFDDMDFTGRVARDHHGNSTDIGADIVARLRQLAFEGDIIPGAPLENALLL